MEKETLQEHIRIIEQITGGYSPEKMRLELDAIESEETNESI